MFIEYYDKNHRILKNEKTGKYYAEFSPYLFRNFFLRKIFNLYGWTPFETEEKLKDSNGVYHHVQVGIEFKELNNLRLWLNNNKV